MTRIAMSALWMFVLTGCVATRGGPDLSRPRAAEAKAVIDTASVVVRARSVDSGGFIGAEGGSVGSEYADWAASAERAVVDSGLFREVSIGLQPAARRIRVEIVREQAINQAAMTLNGATFTLLPVRWIRSYAISLGVEDESGDTQVFTSTEEQRVWLQLLMLPLMPFASAENQGSRAIYDLTLDALAAAQREGAI